MGPSTKPEAPIRWKYIACEVITAGPQRFERGRQPRPELDETADRRRRAFAHGYSHPLELLAKSRLHDALEAHDNAIGTLALFPHLDEARKPDAPRRCGQ